MRAEIPLLTRILGTACRWCPACRYGRRRPASLVGRILNHPLHADHCPFWRAEKALPQEASSGGVK